MLKICLVLAVLGCAAQIRAENVPAFIWGGKSDGQFPALHALSGDEFVTFVKSQASSKDAQTIVFIEKSLSVEDLSQCRTAASQSCFSNLRQVEKKTYLTAVEDPVKALESSSVASIAEIQLTSGDDLNGKLDKAANSKLVFVYLDDVESSEDFVKHDELISKFYSLIASKSEHVIAIYTGRHPSFIYSKSLIRKVRDTSAKQENAVKIEFKKTEHVMVALSAFYFNEQTLDLSKLVVASNLSADKSTVTFSMKIDNSELDFEFVLSAGTWDARETKYGGRRFRPHGPVDAYEARSFGCGNLTLTDSRDHVTLENFQVQPHFDTTGIADEFGNHNDCVGYFSPAIWGALFVTFLMLFILSYGFMMIMDIRTMDRFDDPKGKTITINAQE